MDHGAEESDAEKAKELLKRFNVTVFFIDTGVMVSISFMIPISHVLFCLCVYVCFFFFWVLFSYRNNHQGRGSKLKRKVRLFGFK